MMTTQPHEINELAAYQIRRLETQLSSIIYITKAVLSLLERMAQGESVPVEQIQSLDRALDTLTPKSRH